ncbi:putative manganese-dependent inorganic diphosphatase [Conexibacter sp. W3-3-2]|nr:putative manganese-dependent inorganic diphosphatase [Conexibacter sp. W3-3-2]
MVLSARSASRSEIRHLSQIGAVRSALDRTSVRRGVRLREPDRPVGSGAPRCRRTAVGRRMLRPVTSTDATTTQVRPRVYVSGHRNPDTDSIGAALGYAELKSRLDPATEYVPVRLGELNPQTTWALEQSGAESPRLLEHISVRAGDVMQTEFPCADAATPLRRAGQMMVEAGLDLVPVVDDDGILQGVLTERALARRYLRESSDASHLYGATAVGTLAEVLEGQLLAGPADRTVHGRIWVLARDLGSILTRLCEGDVAVVGDRHDAQLRALELGISALVVTNATEVPDATLALATERDIPVIATPLDTYVAGRMIGLSSPCQALADPDPLTINTGDVLGEVAEDIKDVSYRAAVVVDRANRPVGLVTRADLVDPRPRRVILVDHAERSQSIPGIEEAEIVEILDHHHIGSIETTLPVRAIFDPVGSTSTLVYEQFLQSGYEPSRPAAGMLLAAILSDTVILTSPTMTSRDEAAVEGLAGLLGIDARTFGREMFQAGSDVAGLAAAEILGRDLKAYELPTGQTLCVAQIETVGDVLSGRFAELEAEAAACALRDGHRLVALMVTDVDAKGTHLVVAGDVPLAERAFGASVEGGAIPLPGVMSRKKQVAPKLLQAA